MERKWVPTFISMCQLYAINIGNDLWMIAIISITLKSILLWNSFFIMIFTIIIGKNAIKSNKVEFYDGFLVVVVKSLCEFVNKWIVHTICIWKQKQQQQQQRKKRKWRKKWLLLKWPITATWIKSMNKKGRQFFFFSYFKLL